MKELTIEQKAQRYDEAIEIAKRINNEQQAQPFNIMTRVFPELAESEDDRIRKEMLQIAKESEDSFYMAMTPNKREKLIAWLEKQGEQNPVISEDALREGIAHFGITQYQIDNWLKKYVDVEKQVEQKPTGWSEEDEELMKWSINNLTELKNRFGEEYGKVDDCINWLKSLKERYTWKPSEEQIEVLESIRKILHADKDIYSKANNLMYNFEELIRTLKKLREE